MMMNNVNSGYNGYSMSNRAVEAYDEGLKPKSKFTKDDFKKAVSKEQKIFIDNLTLAELKQYYLIRKEWHHTSNHFNKTDFYMIDADELEKLGMIDLKKIKDMTKREKEEAKQKKLEAENGEKWICKYLIWSGTRKHPKAEEFESAGVIKGNWFYPDGESFKKSIKANGFYKVKRI